MKLHEKILNHMNTTEIIQKLAAITWNYVVRIKKKNENKALEY